MTGFEWTVPAAVATVVDGDTLDLRLDLGFRVRKSVRTRLAGVDTAEIYGVPADSDEYARGHEQMDCVDVWVGVASGNAAREFPFLFHSHDETGKYGRWVGDLERRETGETLTEHLISEYPAVAE